MSQSKVKHVLVKLTRIMKFRSHGEMAQAIGEPILKFTVFSAKYDGIDSGKKHAGFSKRVIIDLADVFGLNLARYNQQQAQPKRSCLT